MARIRTIKPEFWTSEQIVELSVSARLLFVGVWTFSDDAGIHPASCKRLNMEVFPSDNFTVEQIGKWIDEILAQGLMIQYEAQGKSYWQVTGWEFHQKIDKKTFRHPQPSGMNSTTTRRALVEPSPPESKGEESKGEESKGRNSSCRALRFDEADLATATWILDRLRIANPGHKQPNLKAWANTIRLIREQDKRTDAEIRELFQWAHEDEFWGANILCPKTLRKQWDKLAMRRKSDNQPKGGKDGTVVVGDSRFS